MKNRKVSGNDFPALHYAPDSYRDCALQQQTTNNEQQTNHHASSLQINGQRSG